MESDLRPQDKERLGNKDWRINHLYFIKDKNKNLIQFKRNRAQQDFNKNKHTRNIILKSRQLGFCLAPETRILTADLKWIAIKDLEIGREIVAVDEYPLESGRGKSRRMRTANVQKIVWVKRKAYKIILSDGRIVICTGQHPWLSKKIADDCRWRAIEKRDGLIGKITKGTFIRTLTIPWGESLLEDYWFGGILDGEGNMDKTTTKKSPGVNASQLEGFVWNRMVKYAQDERYNYRIENDDTIRKTKYGRSPVPKLCFGRMDEIFRLLGKTRPTRFINRRFWEGRWLPGRSRGGEGYVEVIDIIPLNGERDMVDLQTSMGTYIAEGLVSHNTTDETLDTLDDSLFTRNFDGILIGQDLETAKDIFSNKVDLAWQNFRLKELYKVNTESARQFKFEFGDGTTSSISVDSSGRSGTFSRVHITEFAKVCKDYPDKAKEIIEGTIPAVPLYGRVDIEGTADGSDGKFYNMFWEAWERGETNVPTQYKAHFYNWQWDDEEIAKITDGQIEEFLSSPDYSFFQEYQKDNNSSDREITYYYFKWLSLERNWHSLHKEYPTTPFEAFSSSGNKLFDEKYLSKFNIEKPIKQENEWSYWEEPRLEHTYCWGADVGEGIGKDHSTIVIWDLTTLKPRVVATYKNNQIAPDLLAYEIKNGATKYEYAFGAVERNNHGHTTISKLREIYPEKLIYQDDKEKFGWQTNLVSKPKMMFDLNTAVNNELVDIPSQGIVSEMRRYDKEDLRIKNYDDEATEHYDLLTACAIGFQMKDYKAESLKQRLSIYIPEDV